MQALLRILSKITEYEDFTNKKIERKNKIS